jgi:hypothetical protein
MVVHRIQGPSDFTLVLTILRHSRPEMGGHAVLRHRSGEQLTVKLTPRLFRVLRVLVKAWLQDSDIDPEVRGTRSSLAIREDYAKQVGDRALITPEFLTQIIRKTRIPIEAAIVNLISNMGYTIPDQLPTIIRTLRGLGYRIGDLGVELHDHS